jgi:hypothetical protein
MCGILLACSTSTSALRARYAKERKCPESRVAVSEQGGAVYRASGCGQLAEYICESFIGFGNSAQRCRERGLHPREPSGDPPAKVPSRPDLVGPK